MRIMIVIACILSMAFVWVQIESVKTGYDLNKLNLRKTELTNGCKIMQIELSTLKSSERIEAIARKDLGLINPDKFERVVLPKQEKKSSGIFQAIGTGFQSVLSSIISIF